MMRIAVCEDELIQRKLLEDDIRLWAKKNDIEIDLRTYAGAEAFLFQKETNGSVDCLFLDIDMGGGITGLELAQSVRETDSQVTIVFLTALSKYVFSGYKVQAFDYFVKPLKEQDLDRVLKHVSKSIQAVRQDGFFIPSRSEYIHIRYDDVYCFEANLHMTKVHTKVGTEQYNAKISYFEELLPKEQFVKTHRSFIVNLRFVRQVMTGAVSMADGQTVPVSRGRQREVDRRMLTYWGM
ncbi:DNA-binding response regulator [Clostridia bacterium]|nr:DNA-binding response regulator [Clostridia bacterium]